MKFAEREERRGSRYDIILLDPPAYGRGPKGEVWQLFDDLPRLADICRAILTPRPLAVVLTAYSIRASFFAIHALMRDTFAGHGRPVESGELVIREKTAGRALVHLAVLALGCGMSEHRPGAPGRGQGGHQPRQSARQGHQGAGAEEVPRPAERLHGRGAEAGHRRARPRLGDADAGLRQIGARQPAVEKVAARTVAAGGEVLEVSRRCSPRSPGATIRRWWSASSTQRFMQACRTSGRQDGEIWVALDRVRDPGNLGTIIRTVDAAGAKGVILIGETTDPFSLETVRATMGSVFAVPVARATTEAFLAWRKGFSGIVAGTHLEGRRRLPRRRLSGKSQSCC